MIARLARRSIYPALDAPLRAATGGRLYSSYDVGPEEAVGVIPRLPLAARDLLLESGYEPSGLFAAAKTRERDGARAVASIRRVDPDNPRRQFHVHLFEHENGTEAYSHYEYRPDPHRLDGETHADRVWRLREHLSPTWGERWGDGTTYALGESCPELDTLVWDDE